MTDHPGATAVFEAYPLRALIHRDDHGSGRWWTHFSWIIEPEAACSPISGLCHPGAHEAKTFRGAMMAGVEVLAQWAHPPERIQRKRAKGSRAPSGAVNVARPSKWGNPYTVAEHGAANAVALYLQALYMKPCSERPMGVPTLYEVREHLRGQALACWCALDDPCHADVLLAAANGGRLVFTEHGTRVEYRAANPPHPGGE